jgi:proteasome accessory factor A
MQRMNITKVTLVGAALHLMRLGVAPNIEIIDPVGTFKSISRDMTMKFEVKTKKGMMTAEEILHAYVDSAFENLGFPFNDELDGLAFTLGALREPEAEKSIEWLAKKKVVDTYREEEGLDPRDPALVAVDLEFSRVNPNDGLYDFLRDSGEIKDWGSVPKTKGIGSSGRATVRAIAVREHLSHLDNACWASLRFRTPKGIKDIRLSPTLQVPESSEFTGLDVESFIKKIEEANQ